MSKKVIVACGSGIATSKMVAQKITKLLEERDVEADVQAAEVKDLDEALEGAVAYVPVVKTEKDYDVPTINGVAFLTGMGQEDELNRLVEVLS